MNEFESVDLWLLELDWKLTTRMIQNGLLTYKTGQKILDEIEWKICQVWKFCFDNRHQVDDLTKMNVTAVEVDHRNVKERFIELLSDQMQTNQMFI